MAISGIPVFRERAVANVIPDEVIISLGVVTLNKDITLAKSQNDDILKKIIKIINDFNILEKDVHIDYLNIFPQYEYSYNKKNFNGYQVTKKVSIKLKDIKKYESLI